jgi:hypothetical protein
MLIEPAAGEDEKAAPLVRAGEERPGGGWDVPFAP